MAKPHPHGVAIPAALAALDTNEHPLAVDVADLEGGDLGDPEARAMGDAQGGTVLDAGRGREQPGDLIRAQFGRQLAGRTRGSACATGPAGRASW
jgi:hypothetical protein